MDRTRLLLLMLLSVALAPACARAPDGPLELEGATMGTTWRVELARATERPDTQTLRAELGGILASLDARMSTWKPDSELSRFNAARTTEWFEVSADTLAVVREAQRVGRASGGAFDVTVGPLVELWGFGPGGAPGAVPPEREIAAARARVGLELLEVREHPPALRKRHPQLSVDLSGLAKGYAVDVVARHLDARGFAHYLIELGGELRGRGSNAEGVPWRVAVEQPPGATQPPRCVVSLADRAVATSGDYRRVFTVDGRAYAHVVDPRSGAPVGHGVASATVLAPTAAEADAFATALLVLEPGVGLELAERHGLAARLLVRAGGGFRELRSAGFDHVTHE